MPGGGGTKMNTVTKYRIGDEGLEYPIHHALAILTVEPDSDLVGPFIAEGGSLPTSAKARRYVLRDLPEYSSLPAFDGEPADAHEHVEELGYQPLTFAYTDLLRR
jgi:hypothetical protein